jgi:Mn2+/Fe2+ NRAMP family transporter
VRAATGAADQDVLAWGGPTGERRSALDRAHRGDIIGALGRVASADAAPRHSTRRRMATLLAVMGPGVVALVAGNDAGGISTYAQVGQGFGFRFLWLVVALAGIVYVHQEMVARLGAVTGAGHARLIYERFGRRWGAFALGDLTVLNLFVIVTEFIGIALGLGYFGVSRYVSVPAAAVVLIAFTTTGTFAGWERAMVSLVVVGLAVIPILLLVVHERARVAAIVTTPTSGPRPSTTLVLVALVGATVAPWQLFFQQSNVVDKRITTRWLPYERVDTGVGTVLFAVGGVVTLAVCAIAFAGTSWHGGFVDAGHLAADLRTRAGDWAGTLFAVALVTGSVLGAAAVTLSTSYAIGDVTGARHSLHRRWRDARYFHTTYAALVVAAAAIVVLPGTPLGLVTTAVQALIGVLLPSALVFLLLLCNDREVLGPLVNPRWLNVVSVTIVAGLLVLSGVLTVITLFPDVDVAWWVVVAAVTAGAAAGGLAGFRLPGLAGRLPGEGAAATRQNWSMPNIETLPRPTRTPARTTGLVVLRCYLMITAGAVMAKIIRLIFGI